MRNARAVRGSQPFDMLDVHRCQDYNEENEDERSLESVSKY